MTDDSKVRVEATVAMRRGSGMLDEDASTAPSLQEALPQPLEERFVLGARLGKGGMGEVFAARDGLLNRRLALKVLSHPDPARELPRFLREAQVTAQLSHPNIVPVYGLERNAEGKPALSMKLIQGVTFTRYITECKAAQEKGTLDPDSQGLAARIEHFLKVCDAMAYAHSRGVLHRDIKPANLMLGPFGEVYVMDWGIAYVDGAPDSAPDDPSIRRERMSGPVELGRTPRVTEMEGTVDLGGSLGGDEAHTRDGDVLGTPGYMSPEQSDGRSDVGLGPRSDQFALGMVLFELIVLGRARWQARMQERYIDAFKGRRRSFEEFDVDPPRELRAIVDKATAVSADDRYEDVAAFAEDLRRYLRGEAVLAAPDGRVQAAWRKLRNRPMVVATTVLGALLVAAVAVVLSLAVTLRRERDEGERRHRLASLVSQVVDQVHAFDRDLAHVEVVLEGVAVAARDLLAHGEVPEVPPKRYQPVDLLEGRGPPDTQVVRRYRQLISMKAPIVLPPLGSAMEDIREAQSKLAPLDEVMRTAMLRTAGPELAALHGDAVTERLYEGVPLHWVYVGLADGTFVNFPGNAQYPADYDVLERPWFKDTKGTFGPQWGELYPDATGSGFLLPCNSTVLNREGEFLGVVGADLSMDRVIEEMSVPRLTGVRESLLLDADGAVLVSSSERGRASERSVEDNRTKEKGSLDNPGLVAQLAANRASGFSLHGGDLLVFARLRAVPWFLVVRLDPAVHGFDAG